MYTLRPAQRRRRRPASVWSFVVALRGGVAVLGSGRSIDLPASSSCLVPPAMGCVEEAGSGGADLAAIHFAVVAATGDPVPLHRMALPAAVSCADPARQAEQIHALFARLRAGEPRSALDALRVHAALGLLLADHLEDGFACGRLVEMPRSRPPSWIVETCELMRRRMVDPGLSLTALALAAGCSTAYLNRTFARWYGDPPMRWLRRQRLVLALRRLDAGETSVARVARACGLRSGDRLTRLLRAARGESSRQRLARR